MYVALSSLFLSIDVSFSQPNVLVDAEGCPRLSDFCLWTIRKVTDADNLSPLDYGFGARYSAPELLEVEEAPRTKKSYTPKSDVYSLSMIIVEVHLFLKRMVHSGPDGLLSSSPPNRCPSMISQMAISQAWF